MECLFPLTCVGTIFSPFHGKLGPICFLILDADLYQRRAENDLMESGVLSFLPFNGRHVDTSEPRLRHKGIADMVVRPRRLELQLSIILQCTNAYKENSVKQHPLQCLLTNNFLLNYRP